MTGPGETVLQTAGETRFVVDCKVNPAALVGHVKITFTPEEIMVSCGALTDPNEKLNTVPKPKLPPSSVVPYSVVPDKINPANGTVPSLLVKLGPEGAVKLCRFVKPVPLVLIANTAPLPELPPWFAVPYRVLPNNIKPANGRHPSLLVGGEPEVEVKVCRFVKPMPLVLTANTQIGRASCRERV